MAKIFVSYRRGGVRARTYRMADELKRKFGDENVFLDIESLEPGVPFADVIREAIQSSDVVLIMIGPKWVNMKLEDGVRRLEKETDHLRIEVEAALASRAKVIPVLVDGATMPDKAALPDSISRLADLNACSLADSHWAYDVSKLVKTIGGDRPVPQEEKLNTQGLIAAGLLIAVPLGLADGDNDVDTWVGAAAFAVAAFALSAYAVFNLRPQSTKNKVLCIGGMVFSALAALWCFSVLI